MIRVFFFIRKVNAGGCTKKYKSTPFKHPRCDVRRVYVKYAYTIARTHIQALQRSYLHFCHKSATYILVTIPPTAPSPPTQKAFAGLVAPKNHITIVRISVYRSAACCHFWADPQSTLVSHTFHCSKRYANHDTLLSRRQFNIYTTQSTYIHILTWQ